MAIDKKQGQLASLIISIIILIIVIILIVIVCYNWNANNNTTQLTITPKELAAAAMYKNNQKNNFTTTVTCIPNGIYTYAGLGACQTTICTENNNAGPCGRLPNGTAIAWCISNTTASGNTTYNCI